jgi:ribonuclease-3
VFTHGSWVEQRGDSYERLEFLGDSVLGLAVARHLFERFPDWPEGELARTRQVVVSRDSCATVARRLGLVADLVAEGRRRGIEDLDGPARSRAVAAALVEAAIGAVFLHVGHGAAAAAVVGAFADRVDYAVDAHVDYKTVLQEALARQGASVTYRLVETSGPPHRRRFTTAATVGDRDLGIGSGASKKASEQAAAREALHGLGELA